MSTFTNLLFHIVYSTKYRRATINSSWQDELYGYMGGIIDEQRGTLLRAGGVADHVHLLAKLSPTIAISDVLRLVKANSSKWVNEHHPGDRKFQWQTGYAAFSVSESQAATVKRYIDNQQKHHQTRTFEDEFIAMLKRHNIQYDPKFVFEQEIIQ